MTVQARKITLTPPNAGTIPVRQNFYGYGFAPVAVLLWSACTATNDGTVTGILESFGAATQTGQFCVANASDAAVATSNAGRYGRTSECVCLPLNGTPAIDALARLASMGGDGLSLDWTDTAATANMVVHGLVLGGDDLLNATIVDIVPTTTTNGATQTVVTGFPSDCLIFASPAVPSATGIVDANWCVGVATRSPASNYGAFWFENDGATTRDCAVYATTLRALGLPASTAAKDADFTVSSWDSLGFTLTWNKAPAALTPHVYCLALQGGQYQLDALQTATATGTQGVSTSFKPRALVSFGSTDATDSDTAESAATTDSGYALGACDDQLRQGGYSFLQQDGNATSFATRRSSTKFTTWLTGTTGSVLAEASVSALAASSYTLNWTTANAIRRRVACLAIGDNPAQNPTLFRTPQAPII
jgi:hypothetical protein